MKNSSEMKTVSENFKTWIKLHKSLPIPQNLPVDVIQKVDYCAKVKNSTAFPNSVQYSPR